jgi:hypothetical protein
MSLIIGLGCTAQVGKDTAAEYLEKKYPGKVKRVAFADKLKKVTGDLFGLSHEQLYGAVAVKEKVDSRYDQTPREIMQGMGEKMREIHPDIWVDAVFSTVIPELENRGFDCFIISDVRYPNEAEGIHKRNGHVIEITRKAGGVSVGAEHSSETAMRGYQNFDFDIENNGSFEEFYAKIDYVLEEMIGYGIKTGEDIG